MTSQEEALLNMEHLAESAITQLTVANREITQLKRRQVNLRQALLDGKNIAEEVANGNYPTHRAAYFVEHVEKLLASQEVAQ